MPAPPSHYSNPFQFSEPAVRRNSSHGYAKSNGNLRSVASSSVHQSAVRGLQSPMRLRVNNASRDHRHLGGGSPNKKRSLSLEPALDSFMPSLGSTRLVFDLLVVPVSLSLCRFRPCFSLRLFHASYSSPIATPTCWPPCRTFSIMAHPRSNFFEYTSRRWM